MPSLIRMCLVFALALMTGSCGGGDGPSEPSPEPSARGSISGSVQNGGSGVAGVSVTLAGGVSRNATSSSAGTFSFADIAPGAYTVGIAVPSGLVLAAGEAASRSVTVVANQATTVTFQLTAPAASGGTVSGTVRNGTAGVSGATIALSGTGVSRTTTSLSNGTYAFTGVAAGVYTVAVTPPAGFALASGEAGTRAVTVASNATATVDFALAASTAGGNTVTIDVRASSFSPNDITVAPGTRIRWVNNSGVFHTVTPNGHTQWQARDLSSGQTFEVVLNSAGTYNYYCEPHRADGMTGVIRVQ